MGFRNMKNNRRRQGMTEYIVLVGLIALGLVAAVSHFGFRVDEAIQGSENALKNRVVGGMDAGSLPPGASGMPSKTVTDSSGAKWDVHDTDTGPVAVPEGSSPTSSSPPYDPAVHGS